MTNRKKVVNYVKNRNDNLKQQKFGNVSLFIKDKMSNNINLKVVFKHINSILPYSIINLIDIIYVGDFDFLNERDVSALYLDNAIYLSNQHDDEEDLIDDIVHEFAHAVEDRYAYYLYNDRGIEKEFLGKRRRLESILRYERYNTKKYDFLNYQYNKEFDNFLYNEIGNQKLNYLVRDLFLRAYAAVSLREYFATAFEEFYLGNFKNIKEISPYLYEKINLINQEQIEINNNEL